MKIALTLVISVALATVVVAQGEKESKGFVAAGAQFKTGSFSLYDIPDSEQGSAKAVGAFVEGARDFKLGNAVVVPRVLASVERNFPKAGEDFTQFDLRPEAEVRYKLGDFEPLVAAGFNYTEGDRGATQLNPILGAGLQYHGARVSVYRFFPDSDNANARGILYRVDYTKKLNPVGVRVSGEIFAGRSEYPYRAAKHPGYEGTTYVLRVGVVR